MKNIASLLFVIGLLSQLAQAQTNTFPSSGNAGVGTTTPADQLEVVSGNRKVGFNTPVSGVTPGGILSLSRPDDGTKIMFLGGAAAPNDDGVLYTMGGGSELRLVSGGGSGSGFGFYSNITMASAFGSVRPVPVMKIDGSGNVGMGTATPSQKLELAGSIFINSDNTAFAIDANGSAPRLGFLKKAGAYPVFATAANVPMIFGQSNQTGLFTNIATSVVTERMRIDANGNVGIGSTAPSQKLTVNGTIYGKEVKVDLLVPGPDYVFSKTYSLRSLKDVESYIEENQHLPEVPSAVEMEKDGIKVGEMNMMLLKKIEELTLYMIELEKRAARQQAEIEELKSRIK